MGKKQYRNSLVLKALMIQLTVSVNSVNLLQNSNCSITTFPNSFNLFVPSHSVLGPPLYKGVALAVFDTAG
jgi:hypothetical protein